MIHSMTGYGKAEAHFEGKKIHVEIKSLNSKALDLSMRLASLYREREMELRKRVAEKLTRGKVDLCIWTEKDAATTASPLNADVAAAYAEQLRTISRERGIALREEDIWSLLVRLPDLTSATQAETLTDEEWAVASRAVDEALDALQAFRLQEGRALEEKFREKVANIRACMEEIRPYEEGRVKKIRQQLEERLAELRGVDYDRGRLEQELIYYIEKLDISEERQRLTNHLDYFLRTLDAAPGQGKQLGFIAQEMGREINTTGSKSNQAEMQNIVVRMKDELEQIKEQVLNAL
ncbi:MAG: YicC family protein [Alloprevotella sp.]|nr:YicC family protein [Alloprevotella sp.]